MTDFKLWGDSFSKIFQYIDVYFARCTTSSYCATTEQIATKVYGSQLYIMTLNTNYDGNDTRNPIKQYLDYREFILLTDDLWFEKRIELNQTDIKFLNGTTQKIYQTGAVVSGIQTYMGKNLGRMRVMMGPKRTKIEEYTELQPHMGRNLETLFKNVTITTNSTTDSHQNKTKEEKQEKNEDTAFFILDCLSKLGGLLYLLKTLSSWILSVFTSGLFRLDLVNILRSRPLPSHASSIAPVTTDPSNTFASIFSLHSTGGRYEVRDWIRHVLRRC